MAKKRMGEKEVDALLSHYRSERRRLGYLLDQARSSIKELKRLKNSLPKAPPKPSTYTLPDGTVKRRPGRPRKGEVVMKPKRGPGRPPKRKRAPRALNAWDTMVIDAIKSNGRLLPKAEILQHAFNWASIHEAAMKKPEVETFVTRTLQKLSGRKGVLGMHHTGLQRGNHYGLRDWFFKSSGKLRRQHFNKLVLTKEEKGA